jgi:hypothetical protein
LKGLGDVREGAALHRLDGRLERHEAGDHDHLGVRVQRAAALEDLHAVDLLHLQVGQDDVEGLLLQQPQRVRPALGRGDLVALLAHHVLEVAQRHALVVDDEQPDRFVHALALPHAGSRMVKRVPPPGRPPR